MSNPVLQINGLHKQFGALKATDNVSLDLQPGEIHALIGPNGAGKTTLISQIAGGLQPDAGSILLNGQNVTGFATAKRARMGLGRTFQISQLGMDLSVRRNVMIAAQAQTGSSYRFWGSIHKDGDINRVSDAALDRMGIMDRADVAVSELSHGERRRVELACALALGPSIMLLDEPMAGLGHEGAEWMTGFLEDLKSEVAILLVEHDMDAVFRLADRITVLVYGQVIATGNADEIRNNDDVRIAYLGEDDA